MNFSGQPEVRLSHLNFIADLFMQFKGFLGCRPGNGWALL